MQISALETFVMIHRIGSFTRTAEMRNMTLSAVSMQMKALEEELNSVLFDRSFRPPKLTPLGEKVAQDAQTVVEAQAVLRSRCVNPAELAGAFRMGMVPSMSVRLLPGFLEHATISAPEALFDVTSGLTETLCEQVRNGQLDAAVVTEIGDEISGLACFKLAREEMVIIAPLDFAFDRVHDLDTRLPFLHFMPRTGIGRLISQYCRQMALDLRRVTVLDNLETIVSCVERGLGFSMLPKADAERYGHGSIQSLSCAPAPLYRQLSLVTRKDALSRIWQARLHQLLLESLP